MLQITQDQHCLNDSKICLVYKLFILENARNTLATELRDFTEKTNVEIQDFLTSPHTSHAQDCANLLRTLDAKCGVIEQLAAVFKDLRSATDPECLKLHLKRKGNLPLQNVPQVKNLNRSNGVMVSDVLKFGPMLHNVLLASSITKAVQIIGATLSLQQIQTSFTSQKEVFICSISPSHDSDVEVHSHSQDQTKEENDKENIQQKTVTVSQADFQKDILETGQSKETHPNLTQNVPTHLIDQGLWGDVEVPHQKQTSSQLMHFLRTNGKTDRGSVFNLTNKGRAMPDNIKRTHTATFQMEMQHNKIKGGSIAEQKSMTVAANILKKESFAAVPGPVFKIKHIQNSYLTYSCMIATPTELWDIGDIFTEVKNTLSESNSEKIVAFPCQRGTSTILDPFSQSCGPTVEGLLASEEILRANGCTGPQRCINDSMRATRIPVGIPQFQIRKFEEMPVTVSHVVNPSNFYIQHKDTNLQELSKIMSSSESSSSFAQMNCIPDIGAYVMGWFPKQELWCRAQVSKICGMNGEGNNACSSVGIKNIEVEVRRIDYGDTACLSLWNIKELSGEMATCPLQASQVSLANVTPVDGKDWSGEAVSWFKDKVENRTLYARLYPEESKVLVELFMEKGKIGAMRRGASLSLRLAQNGHAKHDQLRRMDLKSCAQDQTRKKSLAWEKYLISCYSQKRK